VSTIVLEVAATEAQAVAALRHTASIFGAAATGGPVVFTVDVPTEAANPELVSQLRQLQIDSFVRVQVAIAPGTPTRIQVESHPPIWYFTSSQGLDADAVTSLARTLRETVRATQEGRRPPTFPAPPRRPEST
jgi:hypothetical protein